jgi:hypothetical protein
MDQATRNKLRNVVTQCRKLLEEAVAHELQGRYGIHTAPKNDEVVVEDAARMGHLGDEELAFRRDLIDHYEHIRASGAKSKDALEQLKREIAFTHLNRLCAYKMMEAREVHVGGQKFREAVSRGVNSNGVKFYLAEHPEDERLFSTGHQDIAYRHFLDWLGGRLSDEIGILFSPDDPANRLYPPQRVLDEVLALINDEALAGIWAQDEAIGWVYQYFTPKELRDQARKESQAPRNSYELAFRNQFFTPRYVVEFLTDNTLGRIWYEMRKGDTALKDRCRYMVRRPTEVFLRNPDHPLATPPRAEWVKAAARGDFSQLPDEPAIDDLSDFSLIHDGYELAQQLGHETPHDLARSWLDTGGEGLTLPESTADLWVILFAFQRGHGRSSYPLGDEFYDRWKAVYRAFRDRIGAQDLPQEEMLRQPVYVPHRPRKDPREIRLLDPAVGSAHFLLYAFDLLLTIYEEAYTDPDLGPALQADSPSIEELRKAVPGLILRHNLHGIDIDLRATQIAALALWLRCQRAYQEMGLKRDRPRITRSNIVCAEPMPGERGLLDDFLKTLRDDRLEALIGRVMTMPEGRRVRATEAMADSLCDLVRLVWEKMQLAGEAGSLLKIEEELQGAIREGQKEWEEKQPLFRITEYGLTEQARESYVRFVPGDGVTFWERAEALVTAALEDFAAFASDGKAFQRKLFVGDAMRGLAFVDLWRERFDVALMNPPFGTPSKQSKAYIEKAFPRTKNDVFAAFIERGLDRLRPGGLLGAITSRTGFFGAVQVLLPSLR